MGAEKEALSLAAGAHTSAYMAPTQSAPKRAKNEDSAAADERAYRDSLRKEAKIKDELRMAMQQAALLRDRAQKTSAVKKLSPEARKLEREAATLQEKLLTAERDLGTSQLAGDSEGGVVCV
jgi:hypothetical protein